MIMAKFCGVCQLNIHEHNWPAHIKGKAHKRLAKDVANSQYGVFVSNIMSRVTEERLLSHFSKFGKVRNVQIHNSQASGIVMFDDERSVARALNCVDHRVNWQYLRVSEFRSQTQVRREKEDEKIARSQQHMDRLHLLLINKPTIDAQMVSLMKTWSLPDNRRILIEKIVAELELALQCNMPGSYLRHFGSAVNGLGTDDCDLDVCLEMNEETKSKYKQSGKKMCDAVITALKSSTIGRFLKDFHPIPSARVPLVKFHHWRAKLDIDMTFGVGLSIHNTELIQVLVKLDSRVRILMYTLRYWTKRAGFSDHKVRVTSYSLFMLLYFYLQNTQPRILPTVEQLARLTVGPHPAVQGWDCRFVCDVDLIRNELLQDVNSQSLGDLLRGFFNYYASADLSYRVLCPRTGLSYSVPMFKKIVHDTPNLDGFKFHSIFVQDPFQLNRNIMGNLNQKIADHFIMSMLEAAARINQDPHDWNMLTFLPESPLTLEDAIVVPVTYQMVVILPFNACELPESFNDCCLVDEAKERWHKRVVDFLTQCLRIWHITSTVTTVSNVDVIESRELKRKRSTDVDDDDVSKRQKSSDQQDVDSSTLDSAALTVIPAELNVPSTIFDSQGPSCQLDNQIASPSQQINRSNSHSALQRITLQQTRLQCEAFHRIWEVKKDLPDELKQLNKTNSPLELEATITEKLLENSDLVPRLEKPVKFEMYLHCVRFGCKTQIEITTESESPSLDVEHFKTFMFGYVAKLLKKAMKPL